MGQNAAACRSGGVPVIHVWYIVEPGAPGLKQNAPLFQGVNLSGEKTVYKADGSYWRSPRPLVVLTNAGTGSGGEIFAAAIKEHRSGLLVGTTTSGCVSTGQMFPLPDGSALEIAPPPVSQVPAELGIAESARSGPVCGGASLTGEAVPPDHR